LSQGTAGKNRLVAATDGGWPVLVLRMTVRQIQSREFSEKLRTILLLLGEQRYLI
jgi:hypothetical protein